MSQIIGHLFQRPSSLPCLMRKIVTQIMNGEIGDEYPLLPVCLPLKGAEPVVNAVFREMRTSLGGESTLNSQQKASSAATFLLRACVAGKSGKGKPESVGRRKWSSGGESKQAVTLHFMSASCISPLVKMAWLLCQAVYVIVPNESLTTGTLLSPAYKSINTHSNQQDDTFNHF